MSSKKVIVIGGGAAAYFFVSNSAPVNDDKDFIILEQGKDVLQKVKVSGGGRCNVTNVISDPKELVKNYPRGAKELLGPFYHFGTEEVREWFESRSVPLKIEEDGRVFPLSNKSQSIIDCLQAVEKLPNVTLKTGQKVIDIIPLDSGREGYEIHTKTEILKAEAVMISCGSSQVIWAILEKLGVKIVAPVPSLFTFQIEDLRLQSIPGVSVPRAIVQADQFNLKQEGPLLITHKGLSGPAILKLSAFGAREFNECKYHFEITVNFQPSIKIEDLIRLREQEGKKLVHQHRFELPRRLQEQLFLHSGVDQDKKWGALSNTEVEKIYNSICQARFQVSGQNTFKEEFVTAGGVDLSEINWKNLSAKKYPNLYFAGEVLNIDAITGGFNFQAAWTTAYLASQDILK